MLRFRRRPLTRGRPHRRRVRPVRLTDPCRVCQPRGGARPVTGGLVVDRPPRCIPHCRYGRSCGSMAVGEEARAVSGRVGAGRGRAVVRDGGRRDRAGRADGAIGPRLVLRYRLTGRGRPRTRNRVRGGVPMRCSTGPDVRRLRVRTASGRAPTRRGLTCPSRLPVYGTRRLHRCRSPERPRIMDACNGSRVWGAIISRWSCAPAVVRRDAPAASVPVGPQPVSAHAGEPVFAYLTRIPSSPGAGAGETPRQITLVIAAL